MKFFVFILIFISVFTFASCSKKKDGDVAAEIVIDEGYKTAPASEEIVIDEQSFTAAGDKSGAARAGQRERDRIIADNSRITTMYDGFGNKTEIRFFDNHPLLTGLTIRTTPAGEKQVFLYAQNGSVGRVPENMFDRVLSAPANDLAAAANITEGRRESSAPTLVESSEPLQPQPSYKFPIQTPPPEVVETDVPEPSETPSPSADAPPKSEKDAAQNPTGAAR